MKAEKLKEECAVFGISLRHSEEAAGIAYNGLLSLQHRGQEAAGIAVLYGNDIMCQKDTGLVSEVFSGGSLKKLPQSKAAVGHTRYSTSGSNTPENGQPFVTEYLTGRIATSHNGNILNAREIKKDLESQGLNFKATSDSEVISALIAYHAVKTGSVAQGAIDAARMLKGAFSLVVLTSSNKLIAIRDPNGFRPLCLGKSSWGMAVASESCALESGGFEFFRDIRPGEIVIMENGESVYESVDLTDRDEGSGLCIFEYVYFARPDSFIDGLSVYEARFRMGAILSQEYPVEADAVCGVPDSGIEAAMGYSAQSGIALVPGFVKNRYIGRSFIYPMQSQRESAVRLKLNPLSANVKGKRIVLVDDSIVRGTTSANIVKSLKNAGAAEVHMRISSPPFLFTCHYGTDIDSEENLIANNMDLEGIRKSIGADSLGYISIKGLKNACKNSHMKFCTTCFTGGGPKAGGKFELESPCQGVED
ncbi:MAG: amidophosphoribosyltransferase [Clostridiales bacterium]|jgi:amidophosphoribosyltransferase|nr:amidophosphoribosyltransferase [Clostridiales bacterium]